jgi:hypothetical protein
MGHTSVGNAILTSTKKFCHQPGMKDRHLGQFIDDWGVSAIDVFVDTLLRNHYAEVIFLGDSVSVQFGHFLGCDLARRGFKMKKCAANGLAARSNVGGCDIITSKNGLGTLKVVSERHWMHCLEDGCPIQGERGLKSEVNNVFKMYKKFSIRQLLVYNIGMHVRRNFEHNVSTFAEYFLSSSKLMAKHNTSVIFRETTSTHFPYSTDGAYNKSKHNFKKCCDKSVDPSKSYRTDKTILSSFQKADPNWKDHVSWMSFHNETQPLYNLHTNMGRMGVDCAHFIYVPGISTLYINGILASLAERAAAK